MTPEEQHREGMRFDKEDTATNGADMECFLDQSMLEDEPLYQKGWRAAILYIEGSTFGSHEMGTVGRVLGILKGRLEMMEKP